MSTKKEMLGKENRKENRHRRYSLLLLALLFIGFASYGTYAYFTSSTSTQKGHLTLNGMSQDYNIGGKTDNKTGDGTTNINDNNQDNNDKYVPGTDGKGDGKFVPVTEDEAEVTNSEKFGEFDWVYIGNSNKDLSAENLLTDTETLGVYNKYLTTSDKQTFGNVVGGDVFRKTVRLEVEGSAKVPVQTTLQWEANDEDAKLDNVIAGVFVKRADVVKNDDQTTKAAGYSTSGFTAAIADIKNPKAYTDESISVKPGQYLDIEIVAMVKNGVAPSEAADLNLAKIARQLTVTLQQNVSTESNTSVLANKPANK
ncbi:hypothetical protein [Enterococcus cecorum]|uniref:hypothetical protein n=1 Tax=Enterococcus cecorum TaxID=44008 RepID=UPI0006431CC1|nr:hypothetical protein [Enterococcus cecorum]KLO71928.1 hypothetical protein AA987_03165 [Enterococcus cecorum]MCJ0581257.1 hypothetical protein [Enterococcus cecorum]MDZ5573268.1 hypothetical protein [Enterococcus cecorum]MDZ5578250.1 hypothetical protein [Enterococcus cecorum]CAI3294678.1 hypothetical protein CIRMBP1212_00596 [Enterococcus cecorum]